MTLKKHFGDKITKLIKKADFLEDVTDDIFKLLIEYMNREKVSYNQSIVDLDVEMIEPMFENVVVYLRRMKLKRVLKK